MKKINFENIPLTNDFMFGKVLSEPDRYRRFLETILDIRIDHVEILERQKSIDAGIDTRGIRLDIYMDDGKTVYNCEMQNSNGGDLPRRSRYYQSQIDHSLLEHGEPYHNLKNCIVIFICSFDPFGSGQYRYSFENICLEDSSLRLTDGSRKIFINTGGHKGNVTQAFRELMQYLDDPNRANVTNDPLVKDLDQAVRMTRDNSKWRHDYMTLEMYLQDRWTKGKEEGKAEGKAEGIAEGIAKGIAEGMTQGQLKTICSLVQKGLLSVEEGAKELGISQEALCVKLEELRK